MRRLLSIFDITRIEIYKIIILFCIWRLLLVGVGLTADRVLKYAPSFPYADTLLTGFSLPRFLYSWANFDGVHYLTIAKEGYTSVRFIQAFFPLLPAVILRPVALITQGQINLLAFGLIVTQLAALLASLSWFALVKHVFGSKLAWTSLFFLLLFPTSFFLGALYTEGLFLTFVFGAFLAAAKKNWWVAAGLAALASATRVVGIFLVPALLLELYLASTPGKTRWTMKTLAEFLRTQLKNILILLMGSVGLIAYMVYLKLTFNDPLAFFHVQSAFGAGRQTTLVPYPQVVFRALKILLTSPYDLKYLAYLQEFAAGTLGLIGILVGWKYFRPSWMVFSLLAFLLPTTTGTFSSMSRYLLVSFPVFILVAKIIDDRPLLKACWWMISGGLLLINTLLFIQGYWVA